MGRVGRGYVLSGQPPYETMHGAQHNYAPPFTEAEFEIRYGTGVDTCAELIELGLSRGLLEKSGNHLSFAGTTLGNGREKSRVALAQSACAERGAPEHDPPGDCGVGSGASGPARGGGVRSAILARHLELGI